MSSSWTHTVSTVAFHPLRPLMLLGTTSPTNSVYEIQLDEHNPTPLLGTPFAASAPVTHVMYWHGSGGQLGGGGDQDGLGVATKVNRRAAVVIQEDRAILVVDMIRRNVLFRHEPRSVRLLNNIGRITIAKIYTPYLYFVAEAPPSALQESVAQRRRKNYALHEEEAIFGEKSSSALCVDEPSEFVPMPTVPSLFILCLNKSNLRGMGKLDSATMIEHVATHPLAPVLAVGHAVDRGMGLVRLYTHFSERPMPYSVIGSSADANGTGKQILSVAFLPTTVSATAIEAPTTGKKKKNAAPLVVLKNALLAIAKAKKVAVFDVSIPGTPLELYYVTAPADRLFLGCYCQFKDPTVLWIADTDGQAQPYAINNPTTATSKVMEVLPTTEDGAQMTFPTDALPFVLQQAAASRQCVLPWDRDGHKVMLAVPGAHMYKGRTPPTAHTNIEFGCHPSLPLLYIATLDKFIVKRLAHTTQPQWLEAAPARTSSSVASSFSCDPAMFRPSNNASCTVPKWFATADCDTLDPCAIRVSLVSSSGGAHVVSDDSTTDGSHPQGSWPTANDLHGFGKSGSDGGYAHQRSINVGAVLEETPVSLLECHLVTLSQQQQTQSPIYAVIVAYYAMSLKPMITGKSWAEKKLAVMLVCEADLDAMEAQAAESAHVDLQATFPIRTTPCSSFCVDNVSGTLYFTAGGCNNDTVFDADDTIDIVQLSGDGSMNPQASKEFLDFIFSVPIRMTVPPSCCNLLRGISPFAADTEQLAFFSAESENPEVFVVNNRAGILLEVDLTAAEPVHLHRMDNTNESSFIVSLQRNKLLKTVAVLEDHGALTFFIEKESVLRKDQANTSSDTSSSSLRLAVSLEKRATSIAWMGNILTAMLNNGVIITIDPVLLYLQRHISTTQDGGRATIPALNDCKPIRSIMSGLYTARLVAALPDRLILAQFETHKLKQDRQAKINKAVSAVRELQVRAQTNTLDPTKAKTPHEAQAIAQEQQALLVATMNLQNLVGKDEERSARIPVGGVVVKHVSLTLLNTFLANIIAIDVAVKASRDDVASVPTTTLRKDILGLFEQFGTTKCNRASLQLLQAVGWTELAIAISNKVVQRYATSSALIFPAGEMGRTAASGGTSTTALAASHLEAKSSNATDSWPPSLFDIASMMVRSAAESANGQDSKPSFGASESAGGFGGGPGHGRTDSISSDLGLGSRQNTQTEMVGATPVSTTSAASKAAQQQLGHRLEELSWFPDRDMGLVSVSVAAEILAKFPSHAVPAAVQDMVKKGQLDIAQMMLAHYQVTGTIGKLNGYASKFASASSLHDPRPMSQLFGAKSETGMKNATPSLSIKLDPPLSDEEIFNVLHRPAEAETPWPNLYAPKSAVTDASVLLGAKLKPSPSSHWLHGSRYRRPLPANALLAMSSNSQGDGSSQHGAQSDDATTVFSGKGGLAGGGASIISGQAGKAPSLTEGSVSPVMPSGDSADVQKEQDDLRTAYLNSFKGVPGGGDATSVASAGGAIDPAVKDNFWSDSDDDGEGAGNFGGQLRFQVKFKEASKPNVEAAATVGQEAATVAATAASEALASASVATTSRRIGGGDGPAPTPTLAAPPGTSNRRRITEVPRELSVGEYLRKAFTSFNACEFEDCLQSLQHALPLIVADPEEIANETKIQQLVHYSVCCNILIPIAHVGVDPEATTTFMPHDVVEDVQVAQLMHILQLRLGPDHLQLVCERYVLPQLIAYTCQQAAQSALMLMKFANPELAGTPRLEKLTDAINAVPPTSGDAAALDGLLVSAASAWSMCYKSLRLLDDSEPRKTCGYCGAVLCGEESAKIRPIVEDGDEESAVSSFKCPCCTFGKLE